MIRLFLILFASIVAGGIVHIATIFAIPYYSTNDIWHRILSLGPLYKVLTISDPKASIEISKDLDPTFSYGFCRADVTSAPVLLKGTLPIDFWSLNYIDHLGRSQFSMTNQISGVDINIVLATKGQQRLLQERPELVDDTAIVITATNNKGILVLRSFIETERERERTTEAMRRLSCKTIWDPDSSE